MKIFIIIIAYLVLFGYSILFPYLTFKLIKGGDYIPSMITLIVALLAIFGSYAIIKANPFTNWL